MEDIMFRLQKAHICCIYAGINIVEKLIISKFKGTKWNLPNRIPPEKRWSSSRVAWKLLIKTQVIDEMKLKQIIIIFLMKEKHAWYFCQGSTIEVPPHCRRLWWSTKSPSRRRLRTRKIPSSPYFTSENRTNTVANIAYKRRRNSTCPFSIRSVDTVNVAV